MSSLLFAVPLALALLVPPVPASAQTAPQAGLVVSPPLQQAVLPGGGDTTVTVAYTNTTTAPLDLSFRVADVGDDAFPLPGYESVANPVYRLADRTVLDRTSARIAAGDTVTVDARITDTADFAPGGHYGAILARVENAGTIGGGNVALTQNAAAVLFVAKTGGADPNLIVEDVRVQPVWRYTVRETDIRFRNDGNVHLVPRGTVSLADPFGVTVASSIINETSALLLPGQVRGLAIAARARPFWPGRYAVTVAYRPDGRDTPQTVTAHVWLLGTGGYLGLVILALAGLAVPMLLDPRASGGPALVRRFARRAKR